MADIRIIPSTGLVNVTGSINFTSGGSTMLFMTGSSRNVGIGTATPSYKLDVSGSIRTQTGYIAGANSSADITIDGNTGTQIRYGTQKVLLNSADAYIYTADTPRLFINNGGNVGIGTTGPGSLLTVGTSFATIPGITVDTGNTGNSAFVARKTSSKPAFGLLPWDASVFLSAGIYYDGDNWVHHSNDNNNQLFVLDPITGVRFYASNDGSNSWNVSSNELLWDTSSTWKNLVRSTRSGTSYFTGGSVGIGTSSPSTKLHVAGGSDYNTTFSSDSNRAGWVINGPGTDTPRASSLVLGSDSSFRLGTLSYYHIVMNTNGSTQIYDSGGGAATTFAAGGNVGIGTTSPSNKLQIVGGVTATSFTGSLSGNAATATSADYAGYVINQGGQLLAYDNRIISPSETNAGYLQFGFTAYDNNNTSPWADYLHLRSYTDGSGGSDNLIVFKRTGGIGMRIWQQTYGSSTAYSSYKDVAFTDSNITGNAATATTASFAATASSADTFYARGNVGIGVTNPSSALHVNGQIINATNVYSTGIAGLGLSSNRLGFDESGVRSWSIGVSSGTLSFNSGDGVGPYNFTGGKIQSTGVQVGGSILGTNTAAIFGATNPVSMVFNSPIVAFNSYYNSGWVRYSTNYYSGFLNMEPSTGTFSFNTDSATTGAPSYTERFTLLRDGNVGIGTASPGNKLHVVGNVTVQSGNISLTQGTYITWNNGDNTIQGLSGYHVRVTTYDGSSAQNEVIRFTGGSIASGGARVGIGTSVPIAKLHVSGSSGSLAFNVEGSQGQLFSVTDSLSGSLMSVNDISGLPILEVFSDDKVVAGTFGSNALVVTGSSVGVGTPAPIRALDVYNSSAQIVAQFSSSNATSTRIKFSDANTGAENVNIGAIGTRMAMWTNNAERMSILSGGNVGIGTTNPSFPLHVVGYARASGFSVNDGSGAVSAFIGYEKNWIGSGTSATLAIAAESQKINFYTGGTTDVRMMVSSSGNVGIGTTSPTQLLHIVGTNAANNGITLQNTNASGNSQVRFLNTSGTERAAITYVNSADAVYHYTAAGGNLFNLVGGNVGIGTASPAVLLHIYGSGNTFTRYTNTTSTGHYIDVGANSAGESFVYGYGAYPLLFGTNGTERMRILSGGNVGIGTTSPSYRLVVNKVSIAAPAIMIGGAFFGGPRLQTYGLDADANAWMGLGTDMGVGNYEHSIYYSAYSGLGKLTFGTYDGTTYTTRMLLNASGNLGIGSTAPGYKLVVAGDSAFTAEQLITYTNAIQTINGGSGYSILRLYASSNAVEMQMDSAASAANVGTVGTYSNHPVYIKTNNTTKVAVATDGNVGIGTTAPGGYLDIKAPGDTAGLAALQLRAGNSATNFNSNQITLAYSNTAEYRHAIKTRHQSGAATGNSIDFYLWKYGTDASTTIGTQHVMSLDAANVGIGSTAPAYKLDVAGDINFTSTVKFGGRNVIHNSSTDVYINGRVLYSASSLNDGMYINYDSTSGAGAHLRFFANGTTERMRIDASNGNVGIGTTSPSHRLHVNGGGIRIQGSGDPTNSLRFDDTGGTSRNAMYVSSSNYLVMGNANYAGLQLIHTGSAPARNDGSGIDGYYGTDERTYLSEPNNWLAVRINSVNYVIPMYQV